MTQSQAEEFVGVVGPAETPLALHVSEVVCVRCDQPYLAATAECPGRAVAEPGTAVEDHDPRTLHHWNALMTLELTPTQAAGWAGELPADPGGDPSDDRLMRPHGLEVHCGLCGQQFESADAACPERAILVGDA